VDVEYKPYAQRPVNTQYRDALRDIVENGEWVPTKQGPRALTAMQQTMKFDLADGFPVITERKVSGFWKRAIGELCAFINGETTLDGLEEFGCTWWGPWASEEKTAPKGIAAGSLGPGSYGGAFKAFPTSEGEPFDQFKHLVEQITDLPDNRTHFVTPWIPQYQTRGRGKKPKSTIAPCHGWVHVRILNGRIHLHMFQRSGDMPVGVPSNMIQYAALVLMLEQLTDFRAGTYYHTISDAHIYEDQLASVEEMLQREPRALPTVRLTDEGRDVKDLFDFRSHHFEIADYFPHDAISRIPVAT
jgi:thymidylate synthase